MKIKVNCWFTVNYIYTMGSEFIIWRLLKGVKPGWFYDRDFKSRLN